MQKVILGSLFMSAASGASFSKSNIMDKARESMRAQRDSLSKSSAESKKAFSIEAKEALKKEGNFFSESKAGNPSGNRFFEVRKGMNDCHSTVGMVEGGEVGRCTDDIYEGNGMGHAESEMLVEPNNGGFPIVLFFDGHGCDEKNFVGSQRIHKTDFGFPPDYNAGGCMPFLAEDQTTVMFHASATWSDVRFMPNFDAVLQGTDGKEKGCQREKYSFYEMLAAQLCMDEEDDQGNKFFTNYDVSSCDQGFVVQHKFSDQSCTVEIGTKHLRKEICLFDFQQFNNDMQLDKIAYLEYKTKMCFNGGAGGPY